MLDQNIVTQKVDFRARLQRIQWLSMVWLWIIVAVSTAVASIWLVRVPFYQEPDELAHMDYAFQLFDAGRPFRVTESRPHGEVAPQTRYVARTVGYRGMRYNPYARAPADYGTAAFFRRLDAGAPAPSGRAPVAGAAMPYLMFSYPPAYYIVEAALLSVAYKSFGSLSDGIFAMRAFNILLLAGTLFLTYFSFRAYGARERLSLLAVLAIGTFPLVSWVSSYVQPDNATTFLIAIVVYAVARGRHDSSSKCDVLALGALALLFLVKPHYAFAAWLVTAPRLRFNKDGRPAHPLLRFAGVVLPLLVSAVSNRYWNPVNGLESPLGWVVRARGFMPVSSESQPGFYSLAVDAVGEMVGGSAFMGFWLAFGFRSGRIFSQEAAAPILQACAVFGFATFIMAERILLRRIWVIARVREHRAALGLLLANHPANLYLATTAILVSAHVLSGGALELEGRYWYPTLLPLALVTFLTVPRPLAPQTRRRVATALALIITAYSLFASVSALRAMNADFYGRRPPQRVAVADIIEMRSAGGVSSDSHLLYLHDPQPVYVRGFAIDMSTGFAAKNVYVEVDNHERTKATKVSLSYPNLAQIYNDERIAATRFRIEVPARSLPPGRHRLRFFVGSIKRTDGVPFGTDAWVIVASSNRPKKNG